MYSKILSGIHSGILSGIRSGILSEMMFLSGILSGILSGMYSDILSGILPAIYWHSAWHSFSAMYSDILSCISSGNLSCGIIFDIFSNSLSDPFRLYLGGSRKRLALCRGKASSALCALVGSFVLGRASLLT